MLLRQMSADATTMNRTDMEMMDTDTATPPPPPQTSNANQEEAVWELLSFARQLVSQGKPSEALQAVVMAMRTKGGDEAVFQFMHRARELYRNRLQQNTSVDQLASLFAECAIAEAQPFKPEPQPSNMGAPSIASDAQGTSILAESGRNQIVLDAFSDGSSFICLQCGGLVSNHRKDEHDAYWCC